MQKIFEKMIEELDDKIVMTWEHDYDGGRKDAFHEAIATIQRIAKEQEGCLIEVPCKPGDKVYGSEELGGVGKEYTVTHIKCYNTAPDFYRFKFTAEDQNGMPIFFSEESLGKLLFYTREEALRECGMLG